MPVAILTAHGMNTLRELFLTLGIYTLRGIILCKMNKCAECVNISLNDGK